MCGSNLTVIDKLLSFYLAPDPSIKKGVKPLNPTLGGYLNKILSYWLMKMPNVMLQYLSHEARMTQLVNSLFNHLYLGHCVTDLLVRLCTMVELPMSVDASEY